MEFRYQAFRCDQKPFSIQIGLSNSYFELILNKSERPHARQRFFDLFHKNRKFDELSSSNFLQSQQSNAF